LASAEARELISVLFKLFCGTSARDAGPTASFAPAE
jgi:hypothetical protein